MAGLSRLGGSSPLYYRAMQGLVGNCGKAAPPGGVTDSFSKAMQNRAQKGHIKISYKLCVTSSVVEELISILKPGGNREKKEKFE